MKNKKLFVRDQTARCLLCQDAPCTEACAQGLPVDRILRSLRFENPDGAAALLDGHRDCSSCGEKPCLEACARGILDQAVAIDRVLEAVKEHPEQTRGKADLSIDFCGVHFENPFLLSSSVVGSNYEMVARAFEMGWAGVVFKTIGLFVPEEASPRFAALGKEATPFVGFKNIEQISDHTPEENFAFLKKLKQNYPEKVIVASIMGRTEEEWRQLAAMAEEAGADMIECNFSCPHMSGEGLGSDVGTNPELVRRYTKAVCSGTRLPVLAKMTPNITNMEPPALAAVEAGADGLAAINTIKSVMNIHLDTFVSEPDVNGRSEVGGYSGKAIKPVALRFIHDLKTEPQLSQLPLSGMGGIETWRDAAEFLALGCGTVQVTTAVMQYGYRIIEDLKDGLARYLFSQGFRRVEDMVGKALSHFSAAEEIDRTSIQYPHFHRSLCVGCGRCVISCRDGGHQALTLTKERKPVMDGKKCVGCQLCATVCPSGAITGGTRVPVKREG